MPRSCRTALGPFALYQASFWLQPASSCLPTPVTVPLPEPLFLPEAANPPPCATGPAALRLQNVPIRPVPALSVRASAVPAACSFDSLVHLGEQRMDCPSRLRSSSNPDTDASGGLPGCGGTTSVFVEGWFWALPAPGGIVSAARFELGGLVCGRWVSLPPTCPFLSKAASWAGQPADTSSSSQNSRSGTSNRGISSTIAPKDQRSRERSNSRA